MQAHARTSKNNKRASKNQLVATLDTVIAGVKAGELDEHLAQQVIARGLPKRAA